MTVILTGHPTLFLLFCMFCLTLGDLSMTPSCCYECDAVVCPVQVAAFSYFLPPPTPPLCPTLCPTYPPASKIASRAAEEGTEVTPLLVHEIEGTYERGGRRGGLCCCFVGSAVYGSLYLYASCLLTCNVESLVAHGNRCCNG